MPLVLRSDINFKDYAELFVSELESHSNCDESLVKQAKACISKGLEEIEKKNEEIQALNAKNCMLKKELSDAEATIDKISKELQQYKEKDHVSPSELRNALFTLIKVFSERDVC